MNEVKKKPAITADGAYIIGHTHGIVAMLGLT
jgi:hypothetical protein